LPTPQRMVADCNVSFHILTLVIVASPRPTPLPSPAPTPLPTPQRMQNTHSSQSDICITASPSPTPIPPTPSPTPDPSAPCAAFPVCAQCINTAQHRTRQCASCVDESDARGSVRIYFSRLFLSQHTCTVWRCDACDQLHDIQHCSRWHMSDWRTDTTANTNAYSDA